MLPNPLQKLKKIAQQEIKLGVKQFEKDGLVRVMGKTLDIKSLLNLEGLDPQKTHELRVVLRTVPMEDGSVAVQVRLVADETAKGKK